MQYLVCNTIVSNTIKPIILNFHQGFSLSWFSLVFSEEKQSIKCLTCKVSLHKLKKFSQSELLRNLGKISETEVKFLKKPKNFYPSKDNTSRNNVRMKWIVT